jgi:DNA (cytosine-5)-methyltransferase 1
MTDKISMIELFSGIGAQERALRQLGLPYEVSNTCDCDANAVLSYAAMRWDLEKEMETFNFPSQDEMIEELQAKNLGYDFQKGRHSITKRTSLTKLKQYYIADKLSKNLGDISKVEKLPYVDFWTYSYPCTDLSVAGKGEGMVNKCDKCGCAWPINFEDPKNNNICPDCGNIDIKSTRSGLLGQVQRLLTVSHTEGTLPKYLLLENVKNLVGSKFKPQFDAWVNWLDLIGYNTYYKVLNAKHYGIPQNRERIFAISIRKDIDINGFTFPEQIPLATRLKDMLEQNVDEKYYLPDDRIEKILNSTFMQEKKRIQMTDVCDTLLARDWKDPKCVPVEEEPEVKQLMNIMPTKTRDNPNQGRVYDIDGLAPTLTKMDGGNREPFIVEQEPFIVASRGRNPENPSDRTPGAPTEQRLEPNFSGCTNTLTSVQKDNYVCEPQVLRAERTEYGKAIRKQYEAGEIDEKIGNMREMKPRTDGVANTITTVLKDNYVVEAREDKNLWTETQQKMITEDGNIKRYINSDVVDKFNVGDCADISFPNGYNKANRVFDGYAPALNGTTTQSSFIVKEPIVYDDYNSRISADQDAINTLTCNCGASAERNGVKILEPIVCEERKDEGIRLFKDDCVGTLRTIDACGDKRVLEPEVNPELVGGIGEKNFGKQYRQGNRVYNSETVAMALNAQPVGNTGGYSYLYAVAEKIKWRIRKLTSRECWRLMGFSDIDHDRAAKYTSASARYKMAGNSIVTSVLVALFSSLFIEDGYKSEVWSKYVLHFNDK